MGMACPPAPETLAVTVYSGSPPSAVKVYSRIVVPSCARTRTTNVLLPGAKAISCGSSRSISSKSPPFTLIKTVAPGEKAVGASRMRLEVTAMV